MTVTTSASTPTIDEARMNAFVGKILGDIGAAAGAALVITGDRTGLYASLDRDGDATPAELAVRTGTDERYVTEWLAQQAAAGYVVYDATSGRFHLPFEHALVLAREDSPFNMHGLFEMIQTVMRDEPKTTAAFRDGTGVGWHEHDDNLFPACARFFRPGYAANIVSAWIPALDGVEAKLKQGALVADVGCGHGYSTTIMAQAYPHSQFAGFDYHAPSVAAANANAERAGLSERVRFANESATTFPAANYDLVTCFDCIHDMGDPVAALAHIRSTLASDGCVMIVEPYANDRLEDNLNPVGRIYYAFSTLLCTPAARAQGGAYELGAQSGEARMRDVASRAGLTRFRRATETPFNIVYEARP